MSAFLEDFHFLRPAWLVLAAVALGLWWIWERRVDPLRGWREQTDPELLRALAFEHGPSHAGRARWLLAGWLLATLAIAGPTWRREPNPFADDTTPLMILLKADISMDRPDPLPSRQERARLKIADLAEMRRGQPLGLIAYAGSAHLVLPPTRDTAIVAEMAAQISPDVMPSAGDRLDLALDKAGEILSSGQAGGSLLVIADSVTGDLPAAGAAPQAAGGFPVQFLALADPNSSDTETVREAAGILRGPVRELTVDDGDLVAVLRTARGSSAAGPGGDDRHWQEAGYWLVPLLALLVAASFRRETLATPEAQG